MKKISMLEKMEVMGSHIITFLQEWDVSIKPDHLSWQNGDHYKAAFIKAGYDWLFNIWEKEWADVQRIYNMQTPEMWQRYRTWGLEEHRETILLRKALHELRTKLVARSRPDFYKRSKRNSKANKTKAGLEAAEVSSES